MLLHLAAVLLASSLAVDADNRCGPSFGGRRCAPDLCCSGAGFCGLGAEFCSVPQNCQRSYGSCESDRVPDGPLTEDTPRDLASNVQYGVQIDKCKKPGVIALTYDDGPSKNTPDLLKILAEHHAKATFFVTGVANGRGSIDSTSEWRKTLLSAYLSGHQIASHTWSHRNMSAISSEERRHELYMNERALAGILPGQRFPQYVRTPYVECNAACRDDMAALGYHLIGWEVDSTDWANPNGYLQMQAAVDRALLSHTGSLMIIQHDTIPLSAIRLTNHILEAAKAQGLRAVTLAECLEDTTEAYRSALMVSSKGPNLKWPGMTTLMVPVGTAIWALQEAAHKRGPIVWVRSRLP